MTEQEHLSVVVEIDGFETGRHALEWALREAQIRNCPVQVIHACFARAVVPDPRDDLSGGQVHRDSAQEQARPRPRAVTTPACR